MSGSGDIGSTTGRAGRRRARLVGAGDPESENAFGGIGGCQTYPQACGKASEGHSGEISLGVHRLARAGFSACLTGGVPLGSGRVAGGLGLRQRGPQRLQFVVADVVEVGDGPSEVV